MDCVIRYKHVKHALGWSEYQVRSDRAIRRHWQLVCCAFSFCWYYHSHHTDDQTWLPEDDQMAESQEQVRAQRSDAEKKPDEQGVRRPLLSWPKAGRSVRAWLQPWVMLQRYWQAWSAQPPPLPLQQLLDALCLGVPLFLYSSS